MPVGGTQISLSPPRRPGLPRSGGARRPALPPPRFGPAGRSRRPWSRSRPPACAAVLGSFAFRSPSLPCDVARREQGGARKTGQKRRAGGRAGGRPTGRPAQGRRGTGGPPERGGQGGGGKGGLRVIGCPRPTRSTSGAPSQPSSDMVPKCENFARPVGQPKGLSWTPQTAITIAEVPSQITLSWLEPLKPPRLKKG